MAAPSAQIVGNAFVSQYYYILHHSPSLVHKFYQDISKLGRPEDDGSMSITTTMKAINRKIVSLNFGEFKAEIKSMDAQESFNSGILVLVTGSLIGKDNITRNFTQSFFLAPQEKGYFVLNDVFRYVENANSHDGKKGSASDVEEALCTPNQAEFVDEVQDDSEMVVESAIKIEEVSKKSYPSILTDITSASPSLLSGSKFQEDEWFLVDHRGRKVPKKMESYGPAYAQLLQLEDARAWRETAKQHWNSMRFYNEMASTTCTNGEREDAIKQGRLQEKSAREADEWASQIMFTARSKIFNNTITIDLHEQYVKEAMWLLKRHLTYCTSLRSVRFLKVITGYGSHSGGKSKIKPSVIDLLNEERVEWKEEEENKGALQIIIDEEREFSFLDSDCDTDY